MVDAWGEHGAVATEHVKSCSLHYFALVDDLVQALIVRESLATRYLFKHIFQAFVVPLISPVLLDVT